jgi:hypothetical protein
MRWRVTKLDHNEMRRRVEHALALGRQQQPKQQRRMQADDARRNDPLGATFAVNLRSIEIQWIRARHWRVQLRLSSIADYEREAPPSMYDALNRAEACAWTTRRRRLRDPAIVLKTFLLTLANGYAIYLFQTR